MSRTQQTGDHDIQAALRVAGIIGTFKEVITALALVGGGVTVVGMVVAAFNSHEGGLLVTAALVAGVVGLVVTTYWAMFGWFEHVLRLLARIAADRR
ncbi:hypothetical protein [Nocardioides ungokensis]|uniref:hypothetical protein n=1 Tax=Nocardioides ungokensis TaxID=1643322 RepID=UPI0015DD7D78|nr:hypothetical protein [Nocardioides ungokensis]